MQLIETQAKHELSILGRLGAKALQYIDAIKERPQQCFEY